MHHILLLALILCVFASSVVSQTSTNKKSVESPQTTQTSKSTEANRTSFGTKQIVIGKIENKQMKITAATSTLIGVAFPDGVSKVDSVYLKKLDGVIYLVAKGIAGGKSTSVAITLLVTPESHLVALTAANPKLPMKHLCVSDTPAYCDWKTKKDVGIIQGTGKGKYLAFSSIFTAEQYKKKLEKPATKAKKKK